MYNNIERWVLVEWPEEDGVHSVHSEKYVVTSPHSVDDSITVLINKKEFVGTLLAIGKLGYVAI